MSSVASIFLFAISGWNAIPYTNYYYSVPPPENRIMGVVMSPTNSYRCIRAEDYAYICEMVGERAYLLHPYDSFSKNGGVGSFCGLENNFNNALEYSKSIARSYLGNRYGISWWTVEDGTQLDWATPLGDYYSVHNTEWTNIIHICFGGAGTNVLSDVFDSENGQTIGMSSQRAVGVMQSLDAMGTIAVVSDWYGTWMLPTNEYKRTKLWQDVLYYTNKWTGSGWAIGVSTSTNGTSESGAGTFWGSDDGYTMRHDRRKRVLRGWYYENKQWHNVDSPIIEDYSIRSEGQNATMFISVWNVLTNDYISVPFGDKVYGYFVVKFDVTYVTEHIKWSSGYDPNDVPYTTLLSREYVTNSYAVSVPMNFSFYGKGGNGFYLWQPNSITTTEGLFNEVCGADGGGSMPKVSPYGGNSHSGGNPPTLPDPTAWTDNEHYMTGDEYSYYYILSMSNIDFYLTTTISPKLKYRK